MNFFFDRNVPMKLARMIAGYEYTSITVEHHDDSFEKTTPDIVWIGAVAQRSETWAVLSGDGRILKNPGERAVLKFSGLSFFHLRPGWLNLPVHEIACKLLRVWPKILAAADNVKAPTVFELPVSSAKIDFLCHTADL
ncbi:MAG: hypothetical protein KF754_11390 [Planctomycetes bacterium]|nr:hypothetical protein [Planctomycetota bacterium]